MPKSPSLEDTLSLLNEVQDHPASEDAIATLRQVLNSRYSVAVARTAKLIHKSEIRQLIPELVASFERFMENAATKDPSCMAKKAIAEALYRLEYGEETLFLKGIRHVQMESVWGGKVDTAAGLRGVCALGLVRMNYPDAMVALADLLADPESEARIVAARAVGYADNSQGLPLLRLKVQIGDKDPQVMSECFIGLLKLAPVSSIELVARFLDNSDEQICEMAALALGESRLDEAFPILRDWRQRIRNPELSQFCLLAIAMLRNDEALEFLLSLVVQGRESDAKDAIIALRIYRQDKALWERILRAVETRGDNSLLDST
jgi:HEAT repeat protein